MTINLVGGPLVETSDGQLFVLLTGARGYLGHGIASRLIDEYFILTKNSPDKKLILIICTRSSQQSQSSIFRLRDHVQKFVTSSPFADQMRIEAKAHGNKYQWQETMRRVTLIGVEADFCDIKSVYALASKLVNGSVERLNFWDMSVKDSSNNKSELVNDVNHTSLIPCNNNEKTSSYEVENGLCQLPRIDVVVLTAGIGGWTGVNFDLLLKQFYRSPIETVTKPRFNKSKVGALVKPQSAYNARNDSDKSIGSHNNGQEKMDELPLGEVFCSNVFGQYLLAHELMPLLSHPATSNSKYGGKIIWVSSIANHSDSFSLDDFQGLRSLAPYESSKRLMDLLFLPCEIPSVNNRAASFFDLSRTISGSNKGNQNHSNPSDSVIVRPRNYVVHPGIFQSNILPIPFFAALICKLMFYIARWLGSPWHTIDPYTAAIAPVQIALADHKTLDEIENNGPTKIKWGSATDSRGYAKIKKTKVPGWTCKNGTDTPLNVDVKFKKLRGSETISEESTQAFELLSAQCWKQMEKLRDEWETILKLKSSN